MKMLEKFNKLGKTKSKDSPKNKQPLKIIIFAVAFACIGLATILSTRAATGLCSTAGVIGSSSFSVTIPETAQYRVWVRMQVPDTTNTNNVNGLRLEIAGSSNQCFIVTTTNASAVNQWLWVNADAQAASTPHITSQLASGNYTAKLLGLKAGVKVDKVLLLRSDNTCTPSNDFTNGLPGENCTTLAPTVTLTANPTSVVSGSSSALSWTTTDATACTASGGWANARPTSGTNVSTGPLTSTQTFTLTCSGIGGSGVADSATVTVTPAPAPTVTLTANPTSVVSGSSSILSWASTNATNCVGSGAWSDNNLGTSGNRSTGNLTSTQTYSITCNGAGGSVNASRTVTVTAAPVNDTTPPAVVMSITGLSVTPGQTTITVNNLKDINWQPLASDSSGISTLTYAVNGQAVTLSSGAYKVGFANGKTSNGDYVLQVVATDTKGNVTTSSLTVRLRHPDFDRSGRVDFGDMTFLLNKWGTASTVYDIGGSAVVDLYDFTFVLNHWNSTL